MTLMEWLKLQADDCLIRLDENGAAPAGHNGPYVHPETPVRNTGHWLITFARLFQLTKEEKYLEAVRHCGDYLLSDAARPYGFTFDHRHHAPLDQCNGLIGQAWSMQALVEATRVTGNNHFMDVANEVHALHPFDEATGLWHCREVDGQVLGVDMTLNHQLWFALAAALLTSARARRQARRFLDKMEQNLRLFPNGLIQHRVAAASCWRVDSDIKTKATARFVRDFARETIRAKIGPLSRANNAYQKCIGYHAFNTYAFAWFKEVVPEHPVWQCEKIKAATAYLLSAEFEEAIASETTYGYGYNAPGFEVPFSIGGLAIELDGGLSELTSYWIKQQFERTWSEDKRRPAAHLPDHATASARIYEIARMPPEVLSEARV